MKFKVLWIAGLMLAATAGQVQAGFVNGGFENSLDGWIVTGADFGLTGISDPHSDVSSFVGFDNSGFATLSQSFTTTIGTTYDFSFYSHATSIAQGNILRFQLNSDPIVLATTTATYTQTFSSFVASSTTSVVQFYFENNNAGAWFIDDVSVEARVASAAVPEPASLAIWSLGGLGMMLARRKRQKKNLTA